MEKIIAFNIKSTLGSFQRPRSNNNSSTFHIIPKSALIGLICGIIGLDREFMKNNNMYKILSEKLKYNIILCSPFQKKIWKEYKYNHANIIQKEDRPRYSPSFYEKLVNINYNVYLLYDDNDIELQKILYNFITNIKNNVYVFPPYMGMRNFMCDIKYINEFIPTKNNGDFITKGFCTNFNIQKDISTNDIIYDDIPTLNTSYLAFDNNSYKKIYFNGNCGNINANGIYYKIENELLEFI